MSLTIKQRIWALPTIATIIFSVGLAVSVYYSTTAISSIKTTEDIDYPLLDHTKVLSAEVASVVDSLKDAVSEGDKKRLDQVEDNAKKVRDSLKGMGGVPSQQALVERLTKEFDGYYTPATSVAKITIDGGCSISQVASGKLPAATIDPMEICRVAATTITNTTSTAIIGIGVR